VRKCACSCRGQRPDHRQAVNVEHYIDECNIYHSTSSNPPFCRPLKVAAGQADGIQPRTIEVLQASQAFHPSSCPRMCSCSMPGSMQSYGLADRLLSQAAIMVMAASGKTLLRCTHGLRNYRLSTNQVQTESRSEHFRGASPIFSRLICQISALGACQM
jgi:hypothetical protein